MELSEHGIVLIVEESSCLQAKVYLQKEVLQFSVFLLNFWKLSLFHFRIDFKSLLLLFLFKELFVKYEYSAEGRPRFGVSLGLFVDCLNTFSVPGNSSSIEIRYPGPDMQLLLK